MGSCTSMDDTIRERARHERKGSACKGCKASENVSIPNDVSHTFSTEGGYSRYLESKVAFRSCDRPILDRDTIARVTSRSSHEPEYA